MGKNIGNMHSVANKYVAGMGNNVVVEREVHPHFDRNHTKQRLHMRRL